MTEQEIFDRVRDAHYGALFSPDRKHRYLLWRKWAPQQFGERNVNYYPSIAFIGLNPSTADENRNDPTITRCINFAKHWGYLGMYMLNIFAFRATNPKEMIKEGPNAIGDDNNFYIDLLCRKCIKIVLCWGNHGTFLKRGQEIISKVPAEKSFYFSITKESQPIHPLYLRQETILKPFADCKVNGKENFFQFTS